MVIITLPSELEKAVSEEAAQKGTTPELLTLDVLQERFLRPSSIKRFPEGATLADALGDYIGAVNTRDKYPEGATLSENTGASLLNLWRKSVNKASYNAHRYRPATCLARRERPASCVMRGDSAVYPASRF